MPDIVTGKVFVDGEKGITDTKLNQIISTAVIQSDFVGTKPSASSVASTDQMLVLKTDNTYARAPFSTISSSVAGLVPLADSTQNGMLRQLSGNTTDVVDGTNHCVPIAGMAGITQMRLRSFNAIGNPTFEVDQRRAGAALTNPPSGAFVQDRWQIVKSAGLTGTVNTALQDASSAPIVLPGTSFGLTSKFMRFTVGTAQASLAAGDYYFLKQFVEGPQWRELSSDVHSIQLLVRSSIAGLKFGVTLQETGVNRALLRSVTIASANTWTLLTLPALPVWVGTYSAAPGQAGYFLDITLAVGTTYSAAPNTAWQNGNLFGETGMSNFLATSGATFDIAFVQHEPGALCTTPIDCPFGANLDGPMGCTRYFQKSADYNAPVNATSFSGVVGAQVAAGFTFIDLPVRFAKLMARDPTVFTYSYATGTGTAVRDATANVDRTATGISGVGMSGFAGVGMSGSNGAIARYFFHYTADAGW